jgi:hypothetical protein
MGERVRVFAEGDLAGVLVRQQRRWVVLARFRGPDAEQMARDLAGVITAGGLKTGSDLSAETSGAQSRGAYGPESPPAE